MYITERIDCQQSSPGVVQTSSSFLKSVAPRIGKTLELDSIARDAQKATAQALCVLASLSNITVDSCGHQAFKVMLSTMLSTCDGYDAEARSI